MTKQENNDVIIIKKYANRRLYNTQTSCYITLDDLYVMVKGGDVFEVKDAKTDEDLTRSVLTQIIFDQEAKGYNLLPVEFLRHLIGLYGNTQLEGAVPSYLNISMDSFIRNQEKIRKFSAEGWKDFSPLRIYENIAQKNMDMFENTMDMFKPPE